jgi:hypothetical protein
MDGRKTDDEAIGRIGIGADKDSNTLNSHTLTGEITIGSVMGQAFTNSVCKDRYPLSLQRPLALVNASSQRRKAMARSGALPIRENLTILEIVS